MNTYKKFGCQKHALLHNMPNGCHIQCFWHPALFKGIAFYFHTALA